MSTLLLLLTVQVVGLTVPRSATHRSNRNTLVFLKVICQTKGDFRAKYLNDFPNGGFFVPTRRRLKLGEPVVVSLRIGSRSSPVLLRASVRRVQPGKLAPKVQAGLLVEFLPSEERRRDHLLALANSESSPRTVRRHLRIPIDLSVQWTVRGSADERPGHLEDISIGGACIRAQPFVDEGAETFVTVVPPGAAAGMSMLARVVWTVPGVAFGVTWRARDRGGTRRIKELFRRLEQLAGHRELGDVPSVTAPAASVATVSNDLGGADWHEFNQERSYRVRDPAPARRAARSRPAHGTPAEMGDG